MSLKPDIGELRESIAENHPIVRTQGPASPAEGERPPNFILIVAEGLGMNEIPPYGGGVADGAVPTRLNPRAQQPRHRDQMRTG